MKLLAIGSLLCSGLGALSLGAAVVINEVFYNAPGELETLQWVELHNTGTDPVDLGGWKLRKGAKADFASGTGIPAGGFLVLARDAGAFQQAYNRPPAGLFAGALKHKGDRIELVDASGTEVDAVAFKDSGAWPEMADGQSSSLERICPAAPGTDPGNWAASVPDAELARPRGTPGRTNDVFSPVPIPRVVSVTPSSAQLQPGQTLDLVARVDSGAALKEVAALVRVLTPGKESPPRTVAMNRGGDGTWKATIPGRDSGIFRIQVRAVDAAGGIRVFPSDNDLFPAISVPVVPRWAKSSIPQIQVWQSSTRARASSNPNEFTPEDQRRWGLQNRFQTEANLSRLWTRLMLDTEPAPGQLARLSERFRKAFAERNQMVRTTAGTGDLDSAERAMTASLAAYRRVIAASLEAELQPAQKAAIAAWVEPKPVRTAGLDVDELLRGWLNLDFQFFRATSIEGLGEGDFRKLRSGFLAVAAKRDGLRDLARTAFENDSNRDTFQKSIEALGRQMQELIAGTLDEGLQGAANGVMDEAMIFRRIRRNEGGDAAKRERTAFLHYEPSSGTTTLIDFASMVPRTSGFKVHLPRGRRFEGMSTLNLVFEAVDRFALAEPFAFGVYRRAGMDVSKTGFVRVTINQQELGYHVLIEQPNRTMLRRIGLHDGGHLYKATWAGETPLDMHEKKSRLADGNGDLGGIIQALQASRGDAQWEVVRKNFDVAETIDYFAVNMLLSHWDGYFNNYFAYHDTEGTGRWTFYPWDQDKACGSFDGLRQGEVFAELPLDYGSWDNKAPGWRGAKQPRTFQEYYHLPGASGWWRQPGWFSGPLLSNPRFRAHFVARVKQLLETEFTEEKLYPELDRYAVLLQDEVRFKAPSRGMDPDDASRLLREDIGLLKTFVRRRRAFLLAEPELKRAGPYDPSQLK